MKTCKICNLNRNAPFYGNTCIDNFNKCWALENLRPLSSKDNSLKHNKLVV